MDEYQRYLVDRNYSESTIKAYLGTWKMYVKYCGADLSKERLLVFKKLCSEKYSVASANLRITAINNYLEFAQKSEWRLTTIKVQKKSFRSGIISTAEYKTLLTALRNASNLSWYFGVLIMGTTGVRISELMNITVGDIKRGYADVIGKGGKVRRVYFVERVRKECLVWLGENEKKYVFRNKKGAQLTTRGMAWGIKRYGVMAGLSSEVVHPHSIRHMYAKNFLKKSNNIALLADLLGHDSIETTRIYLQESQEEQIKEINEIVTW